MLLSLSEAEKIDKDLEPDDILALEMSIINYTNNHFHLPRYRPNILSVSGNRIEIDGKNIFKAHDTIEVVGVQYYDGFYHVKEVEGSFITIDTNLDIPFEFKGSGSVFLVNYPKDVKVGAKRILKHQAKANERIGIRSESISRWTVTYDNPTSYSIGGVPQHLYDFLAPYRKMGW